MSKGYLLLLTVVISFGLMAGCSGEKKAQEKATEKAPIEKAPMEKAKESVTKAAQAVPETATKIKDAATEVVKKTVEAAPVAAGAVKETVVKAVEAAPGNAAEVKDMVVSAAKATANKVTSMATTETDKPAPAPATKEAASEETIRLGGSIFKARCVACHGAGGKGSAMAPAFVGNEWVKGAGIAEISAIIKDGRQGNAKKYKKFPIPMPPQSTMSDNEISALANYIKSIN